MKVPDIVIEDAASQHYDLLDVHVDHIAEYLSSRQLDPDYADGLTLLFTSKKLDKSQPHSISEVLGSYNADERLATVYIDQIASLVLSHISYAPSPDIISRINRNAAFHLTRTLKHEIEHDIIAGSDDRYFQAVSDKSIETRYKDIVSRLHRIRYAAAGSLAFSVVAGASTALESGSALAGAAVGLGGSVLTAIEFRRQSMKDTDLEREDAALADYADSLHQLAYDAETLPTEAFVDVLIKLRT